MSKVLVNVQEDMLEQMDRLAKEEGITRSELIRRAVTNFMRWHMEEKMKRGYVEMGEINLKLAEEWLALDNDIQGMYE
jgi:CopG family transcriptional regulator/antitoxin EndoAI